MSIVRIVSYAMGSTNPLTVLTFDNEVCAIVRSAVLTAAEAIVLARVYMEIRVVIWKSNVHLRESSIPYNAITYTCMLESLPRSIFTCL